MKTSSFGNLILYFLKYIANFIHNRNIIVIYRNGKIEKI